MTGVVCWLTLSLIGADAAPQPVALPKVNDPRLVVELVAAEPDIVTPCGLAVDQRGRVLVVESHSHFRPTDYAGPPTDRIRMFAGRRADGRAERATTFFEGTTWTMNVGVHPDGSVYVATRNEIFRLRDTDDDGRADERTPIVHLETKGDYPHNGLSGFAFDLAGNVYFGLGENKGMVFKLVGADGSMASELEGGQVYRCRADGSRVEMLSFGFWNPFHVGLDAFERLFAVDNDPDSLPPCRLIHIVPGGNYGYRYRNGRRGVHPFTAWNGELPGTLPMVSGTGEAPSGVIAYESDNLPEDYVGDLLVTSWGDHRIERHRLEPRGASFQTVPSTIIQGDENFRPVGIATAPDGSVYFSDWVSKSYELHGLGRVWRIRSAEPRAVDRPTKPEEAVHAVDRAVRERAARKLAADSGAGRKLLDKLARGDAAPRVRAVAITALSAVGQHETARALAASDRDPGVRALAIRLLPDGAGCEKFTTPADPPEVRAEALRRLTGKANERLLWQNVTDLDAFVAEAARVGLARSGAVRPDIDLTPLSAPERLAALLILRESRDPAARAALPKFLSDPDGAVRFAAIQWVGEERLVEFRQGLIDALSAGPATSRLFGGYLAALERLDGVVRTADDEWGLDQYIVRALDDPQTNNQVRRWSLRMLRPDHPALTLARLEQYLASDDPALQLEAVRSLRVSRHAERANLLSRIAADPARSDDLRAEAIVGLSPQDASTRKLLVEMAMRGKPPLREEALRTLRGAPLDADDRQQLASAKHDAATRELLERVLSPAAATAGPATDDLAGWVRLLDGADGAQRGDAVAGERIFFSEHAAGCARCHQMQGRGARIGPELTATSGTLSRERLIESIVRPSKEIAPHFATWLVVTHAGKSLVGMLVHEEPTGEQTYVDSKGEPFMVHAKEIESRTAQSKSIMPDNLAAQLTTQEFRDLLAYLQTATQ